MGNTIFAVICLPVAAVGGCFFAGDVPKVPDCDAGDTKECHCDGRSEPGRRLCAGGVWGWDCDCYDEIECMAEGDRCSGGKCFGKAGTERLFCAQECITVGDPCEAGGCYYTDSGSYCFEAGTKTVGESCGAPAECHVGVQCLDADGYKVCWQVCSDAAPCDELAVCEDTGLGFSVCVAEDLG